jgi:hypothetical protein
LECSKQRFRKENEMARKKATLPDHKVILWRIRTGYYPSIGSLTADELQAVMVALKDEQIRSLDDLARLRKFGFKVDV